MAARFTYSRWDGTQRGFDIDADLLFDQLTDELLYHGDVNAALRRMLQEGMRGPDGERLQGLRDLLARLREERQQRLDSHDLGGVYDEINRELDDIVDEERHAIDNAVRDAETSGDERRMQTARDAAAERQHATRPDAARPRRQGARAEQLRLRVERGAAALRAVDGAPARGAHAAGRRADVGGHAGHVAAGHAAHEGHARRAERDARAAPARRGPGVRAVHGAVRRLLPREPAESRRAARADRAPDGGDAGDAELDVARAAGPAATARRPVARRHGSALAARPARLQPAAACSRR